MTEQRRRWWRGVTRDTVLFTTGLALIVNEAVLRSGPERPTLLVLYAGMVGLPAVLRADDRRRTTGSADDPGDRP